MHETEHLFYIFCILNCFASLYEESDKLRRDVPNLTLLLASVVEVLSWYRIFLLGKWISQSVRRVWNRLWRALRFRL